MTTATITITRTHNVPKFYDAAGIAETEGEDIDIEVTLSGSYAPAEPDVGIFQPYFVDIYAEDEDGNEIELSEAESVRAQEALMDAAAEDGADAAEARAEARREDRQFWSKP